MYLADRASVKLPTVPRPLAAIKGTPRSHRAVPKCWGPSSSEGPQKRNLTMSSKHGLCTGTFGFRIKSIHDEKSMIVRKVVVAPKLCARELRLNRRKRNRLKGEKAI
jgi:hypothetical protein